jgi:L-aminopeptidase/D-esterase-like protein
MRTLGLVVCLAIAAPAGLTVDATQPSRTRATMNTTLTAVSGIKVGHHTLANAPTGCTVILAEGGATAGVDVRGMAPATAETELLAPVNLVQQVHALTLSGRSAFGLDARTGVMRYLEERRIGFAYGKAFVPIVPAASLFDLGVGDPLIRPTAECGYLAARVADALPVKEGSVGAGTGATIGKAAGLAHAMKAGVGSSAITMANGLTVAALVVVNAFGDVIDPATGQIIAGTRAADGRTFSDARKLLRAGSVRFDGGGNTTLGVVATNATLTKTQVTRVAQMAHDGYARAISPVHTPVDGDVIFALATSTQAGSADVGVVGALAAEVIADAIVRAARQAAGVQGIPGLSDLRR